MSIGPCDFLLCDSVLATPYRRPVHFYDGGTRLTEIMLCRKCKSLCNADGVGKLMMTTEGWLYTSYWMDALGFYRWV